MNVLYSCVILSLIFSVFISYTTANEIEKRQAVAESQPESNPEIENSLIASFVVGKCDETLNSIFEAVNGQQQKFEQGPFCYSLANEVRKRCTTYLEDLCNKASWKPMKAVCNAYLPDWICK